MAGGLPGLPPRDERVALMTLACSVLSAHAIILVTRLPVFVCYLLTIYWLILLVRVLSSWFPIPPSGPVRRIMDVVYGVTEPVLRPLRGILPPVRMGAMAFDLSPIILFVIIAVLQRSIC